MLEQMGKQAKDAAFILAQLNTTEKNHALSIIAEQLEQQADSILVANQKDIEIAKPLNNVSKIESVCSN
jgi:glutamate-5-semialdehyde dehydrogenase